MQHTHFNAVGIFHTSVLIVTMKRTEGKRAKTHEPKQIKSTKRPKQVLSANKSARITRSQSKELEKRQQEKKVPSQICSTRNTRSKSKAHIQPLQTFSPHKTRSKSEKIQVITLDSESNQQQPQNLFEKAETQTRSSIVSTIRFVKLNDFKIDSTVLAKQIYSIPWPAKVVRIEKERVFVYFFGDRRCGYVSRIEVYDFILSASAIKAKIASKNTPRTFSTGIAEVEMLIDIPSEKSLLN